MKKPNKTKLINLKTYNKEDYVLIDRTTIFGNPYLIGKHGSRKDVIARHKRYFYNRLKDALFREAVESLAGKTLACWCTPLLCHGDVIIEYLESLDEKTK